MNYKRCLFLILIFCLTSCGFLNENPAEQIDKQWVYVELTTKSKTDTTDYFYFGQIKKSIVDNIDLNDEPVGLFTLSDIRYWNTDDLIELYEDEKLTGDKIFKIEDIKEVTLYKDDPIYLYDLKDLHKSAKRLRIKKK